MNVTTFYSRLSPEDKEAAKQLCSEFGLKMAELLLRVMTEEEKSQIEVPF